MATLIVLAPEGWRLEESVLQTIARQLEEKHGPITEPDEYPCRTGCTRSFSTDNGRRTHEWYCSGQAYA